MVVVNLAFPDFHGLGDELKHGRWDMAEGAGDLLA